MWWMYCLIINSSFRIWEVFRMRDVELFYELEVYLMHLHIADDFEIAPIFRAHPF
jgi:hypothetical protein